MLSIMCNMCIYRRMDILGDSEFNKKTPCVGIIVFRSSQEEDEKHRSETTENVRVRKKIMRQIWS